MALTIYHITHRESGKTYVGQTRQVFKYRMSQHRHEALVRNSSLLIHKAIRKYGWDAFEADVLEVVEGGDELDSAERFWIKLYGSLAPNGYNLESGGNGNKTLNAATKKKIGDAHRGKKLSEAHIERLREANRGNFHTKGRRLSEEHRAKMSARMKGKPLPEEWKVAIRKPKTPEARANIAAAVRERCCKLTPEKAGEIRSLRLSGVKIRDLAAQYGVSATTVKGITSGKLYPAT